MCFFQLVHCPPDPGFMGDQSRTDGVSAYQADNIGGNLLVRHLRNSRIELLGGKALPIQCQAERS